MKKTTAVILLVLALISPVFAEDAVADEEAADPNNPTYFLPVLFLSSSAKKQLS